MIQRDNEQVRRVEEIRVLELRNKAEPKTASHSGPHRWSRMDVHKKHWMLSGLLCRNFFDQIVEHESHVAAGERSDETGGILMPCMESVVNWEAGDQLFTVIKRTERLFHRRFRPMTEFKMAASEGEKKRVSGMQSVNWPRVRRRARGRRRILAGGDDEIRSGRQVLNESLGRRRLSDPLHDSCQRNGTGNGKVAISLSRVVKLYSTGGRLRGLKKQPLFFFPILAQLFGSQCEEVKNWVQLSTPLVQRQRGDRLPVLATSSLTSSLAKPGRC